MLLANKGHGLSTKIHGLKAMLSFVVTYLYPFYQP